MDNSDFRNPVNQRGVKDGNIVNAYWIDRWKIANTGRITFGNGFITISADQGYPAYLRQTFEKQPRFPVAVRLEIIGSSIEAFLTALGRVTFDNNMYVEISNAGVFSVYISQGESISIVNIAVYEGEYTTETLPEYQSKGYGIELSECQRYYCNSWFGLMGGKAEAYQIIGSVVNAATSDFLVHFPQTMRNFSTVTYYGTAGRTNPNVYVTQYAEVASIQTLNRFGLNGAYARVTKSSTDSSTWVDRNTIQLHAHWEASADL